VNEKLAEKPVLDPVQKELWDIFMLLHGTRVVGYTAQPIQVSEILACCQMREMDDTERVVFIVRRLDSMFLKWNEDQKPSET
jgi:hypothetical protein